MRAIVLTTTFLLWMAVSAVAGELEKKLIAACQNGNGAAVAALLKKGASPNAKTTDGFTAFMYAVEAESPGAVQALLQAKATVNAQSTDGYSALMIAADKNNPQVAQMLLRAGANSSLKNKEGQTAYDIAVEGHSSNANLFKPGADLAIAEEPEPEADMPLAGEDGQSHQDVPHTVSAETPVIPEEKKVETIKDVEDFFGGRPETQVAQPLTVEQKLQQAEQKYLVPMDGETPAERGARLDYYIKVESKKLADEMAEEFKKGRR